MESVPTKSVMPDVIRVADAMRIVTAMEQLRSRHHLDRVYPYQLASLIYIGYSEQHIRRLMCKMARMNIITRVGGDNSRRGYALQ